MSNVRYRIQVGANWVAAVLHQHGKVLDVPITDNPRDAGEWVDRTAAVRATAMVAEHFKVHPSDVQGVGVRLHSFLRADSTQEQEHGASV